MTSFTADFLSGLAFGHDAVRVLRLIGRGQGRQDLFRQRAPEVLENLRKVAIIESTESSNRLEGITVPSAVMSRLMKDGADPVSNDRMEGEIAGYRNVLRVIHDSADAMRPSPNLLLQMHRDLFKFSVGDGGRWKRSDNLITETRADGSRHVRFRPPPAWQTAGAMENLQRRFTEEIETAVIEPLVLVALYVLDFLCIHPFADGNGRMARLLTVLLLYREGYDAGGGSPSSGSTRKPKSAITTRSIGPR